MLGAIFDLDQTLIDSKIAQPLRDERKWSEVYLKIKEFKLYDQVFEALQVLHNNGIQIAIVTNSPKSYCDRVIKHFNLPVDLTICFHDTQKHKPNAEPILLALEKLRITNSEEVLAFGDDAKDIIAYNKAGVLSVACIWGATDTYSLLGATPNFVCNTTNDMMNLIMSS